MRESDQLYSITSRNPDGGSYTEYMSSADGEKDIVVMRVENLGAEDGSDLNLLIQEMAHGAQYQRGELDYRKEDGYWKPGDSYDITDEKQSIDLANSITNDNHDPTKLSDYDGHIDYMMTAYTSPTAKSVSEETRNYNRSIGTLAESRHRYIGWRKDVNK